jgi:N-acetylmuramoyl-L-alanine amidase
MTKKLIVLDPGHGDTKGWYPKDPTRDKRRYDPGVVSPAGVHEAEVALEMALTAKFILEREGDFDVHLTRYGAGGPKPDLGRRVRTARTIGADALVSLHYNCVKCGPMAYYAPGTPSKRLADLLAVEAGFKRVDPSSSSRFNGLYIDAFPDWQPSILWEIAGVEDAPPPLSAGREKRIELSEQLLRALLNFYRGA